MDSQTTALKDTETGTYEQLHYNIALTQIPKVGNIIAKNLVSHCGSAEAVFTETKAGLLKIPGVGPSIARDIVSNHALSVAEREVKFIEKNNITPLFYLDNEYPHRLKQQYDCPIMLYYKGNADLNQSRIISIVGTRNPTESGKILCEELIRDLAPYNVLILSGLAYGVDICAHRKSVSIGVETVGVLGHGLQQVYPSVHKKTAKQMIEQGGLLSEFISDQGPEREHFPMRNRIIAGMCDALVVIETARKGGSMISAEMANSYSKEVFAFPGRVKDENSQGCNYLIKNHKALMIENAEDLIQSLRWELDGRAKAIQKQLFVELSEPEKLIVDLLGQEDEMHIDRIIRESRFPASEVTSMLFMLELNGLLRSLPGKRYMLIK